MKISVTEWLKRVAEGVRQRIPDARVDEVENGAFAIWRGNGAITVVVSGGVAIVNATLAHGYAAFSEGTNSDENMVRIPVNDDSIEDGVNELISLIS